MRHYLFIITLLLAYGVAAQEPAIKTEKDTTATKKEEKKNPFNTGFYPIGFFDVDLRYLIKYNNYESLRLGIGGITNDSLFENYKIGGYVAYGFKDRTIKYSLGGSARIDKENKTWLNLYYVDDIREIGTFQYLTDARVYSVFEPRLVNVTQFFKHRTWQANVQSEFDPKILSELRISHSNVEQIEDYTFINEGKTYDGYELAEITASVRISPKKEFITTNDGFVEYFDGTPKISAQVTQGLKGIAGSDFNYTKFGLKLDYYIKRTDLSATSILLEGDYAIGDAPITHLFHAYPNSPTKNTILQRFSVAGRKSFETMYFGEFFSSKLATMQIKHSLRRFYFSERFKPELVIITRHAIGNMENPQKHAGLNFKTLDQFYSESGIELNKLLFGFGLSFAYRYGYYHLPEFEDNISFKFTFYAKF
ncbi:DUF5686 family protein [Marixanthomonas spongiae]|uniref:Uncharacterized protein n=1 Tax=Marixanthomonas spongiae TaxID=2174845 RepID=A0A2U0HZI9_9FLAO|nr:DUF5686 family protein [Marixanthomonas spongiae]PVW14292.1 hypothetical protein DDV96_10840 [Marixanthomonas spongiae]